MTRFLKRRMVIAVLLALLTICIFFGWYFTTQQTIPKAIKRQVSFIILYPNDSNTTVDKTTMKYDTQAKVMSFVTTTYGVENTITEQAVPDSFNDIPQFYTKITDQMNGYSSFDTDIGKVVLAHPSSLGGDQVAVMNTKGVLLFAHPNRSLTEEQWRVFFNHLQVIK